MKPESAGIRKKRDDIVKKFVQERNEALLSLDEQKIRAYMRKYGVRFNPENEPVGWAGVHKAILGISSITPEQRERSEKWLVEHGFRTHF